MSEHVVPAKTYILVFVSLILLYKLALRPPKAKT